MTSVCVAGAGTIGSLLAAHLARVADVSVLARRDEHARALNEHGLTVTGRAEFTAPVVAATDPAQLPEPDHPGLAPHEPRQPQLGTFGLPTRPKVPSYWHEPKSDRQCVTTG